MLGIHFRMMVSAPLAAAFLLTNTSDVRSQIINTATIEQLCKTAPQATSRKTIVYVDIASVRKESPQWGLTILNKLELAPRETLTLISVNPSTFEIKEVFDTCYPKFSDSEIAEARKSRSWWDKLFTADPADQQKENLRTYEARLRNALNRIENESQKYQERGRRNVLGAMSLDKNRYSDRASYYRIVVYTDGNLKEALPDDKRVGASPNLPSVAEKYTASFSGAEVSVFGIDNTGQDSTADAKEKIFATFFLKSWARLKAFSPSLPQQESFMYPAAIRMDGTFDGGGAQGSLRLALFSGKGPDGATGWLAFDLVRETLYVPFQGEYICDGGNCRLVANSSESVPPYTAVPYFRKGDKILLTGKAGTTLEGSLQADPREKFPNDPQGKIKYDLKFSAK